MAKKQQYIYFFLLTSGIAFVTGALTSSAHLTLLRECLLIFIGLTELSIAAYIKYKYTKKDDT